MSQNIRASRNWSGSSDDGEIAFYKGNANRRVTVDASVTSRSKTPANTQATTITAPQLDHSTALPTTVTAGALTALPALTLVPDSNNVSAPTRLTADDMEWKYRGRGDFEVPGAEPVSAPSGLPAQKNEGFQKFYKAVVSPTHVRVTAGGRIVPNNRGIPSPASKRATGDPTAEPSKAQDKSNDIKPIPNFTEIGQQLSTGVPHYFPAFPPGYPPLPAYLPMAFGPPPMTGGFPFPAAAGGAMVPQSLVDGGIMGMHGLRTGDGQADKATEPMKASDPNKPPSADQFGRNKSFVYNGPWMVPVPSPFPPTMGGPFMPGAMMGPPPGMGQPVSMPQQVGPPPYPGVPMVVPGASSIQNPGPPRLTGAAPLSDTINRTADSSVAPPISSIKPSDITKKQIGSFRSSLKYHEDQLQYNRHQIDEKYMESKVKAVQEHIRHFEALLRTQLEHEKLFYPKPGNIVTGGSRPQSVPAPSQNDGGQTIRGDPGTAHGLNRIQPEHLGHGAATVDGKPSGLNSGTWDSVTQPIHQTQASGLPSDAARAHTFQPRAEMFSLPSTDNSGMTSGAVGISGGTLGRELIPVSNDEWHVSSESSESVGTLPAIPNKSRGHLGVPYLVGTLPKGIDPRNAKDTDYQYSRALTEDEIRSRHLYWGKAPKFVWRGLPKYDGKHFYPPSPMKSGAPKNSFELDPNAPDTETVPSPSFAPVRVVRNKGKAASNDETFISTTHARSLRKKKTRGTSEGLQKALDEAVKPRDTHQHGAAHSSNGVNTGANTGADDASNTGSDTVGGTQPGKPA